MTERYRIVRFYQRELSNGRHSRRVRGLSGLTLEQAQAHCRDLNTSSSTAWKTTPKQHTKRYGPWFDGYEEDK